MAKLGVFAARAPNLPRTRKKGDDSGFITSARAHTGSAIAPRYTPLRVLSCLGLPRNLRASAIQLLRKYGIINLG